MSSQLPPLKTDAQSLRDDFKRYFHYTLGRDDFAHSHRHQYLAFAYTLRDRMVALGNNTRHAYENANVRRTCYLSMEYLIGRTLRNAMLNLDADEASRSALDELGLELEEVESMERDAGLGNGGLGRLAACFLDSAATLGLPVMGYGLRYQYGMFHQRIDDGYQVEEPDPWLREGHPWEIARPEYTQRIHFGGHSHFVSEPDGRMLASWVDSEDVLAVPHDVPIPGYRNGTVNTLRLWSACATAEFNLNEFNAGYYAEAVAGKNAAERITLVLYPNDASENGKELRLKQQYLLASASLQDVLRQWVSRHGEDFSEFADQFCFQLNDTHPSIAVAELMRLLLDEHHLTWDAAWSITSRCMAYTNHTLLPEALERWPVRLLRGLLPRPMDVIEEINARFLAEVARWRAGDVNLQRRMSIIDETGDPSVRMAHLAIVGSFSINGVAALHSKLLQQGLFLDFAELWPERFTNKTNGVTPRRWLQACNPRLSKLVSKRIGEGWRRNLDELQQLSAHVDESAFRTQWHEVKQANKVQLLALIESRCDLTFTTEALFDVQVKRIHEYKRQLLNLLHVIHLYRRIKDGDVADWTPRCVLIAGKAAPGYATAKLIIKLINNVARVVNTDVQAKDLLRVVFLPDYGVSAMEIICPGADVSQQISTAGKEASGTGNMKLMMNGAVTVGTLDGANIEILEAVGRENFFQFGLDANAVEALRSHYDPEEFVAADPRLDAVLKLLRSGHFNQFEPGVFDPLYGAIMSRDEPWMTAADFSSYVDCQQQVALAYQSRDSWVRMCIANTAASGRFSSDRTIAQYNNEIWRLPSVQVG
jgi:glycogen phosphorylase